MPENSPTSEFYRMKKRTAAPVFNARLCLVSLAMIAFLPLGPLFAAPYLLYVSNDGNDSWSGKSSRPNSDKSDGPFATLERARNEIRRIKVRGKMPPDGIDVLIRGGTYCLDRTFRISSIDSGLPGSPVTYRAYPNEKVTLTGGRPIKNFSPYKGRIYQVDVGAQGFRGIGFRQLFFNGTRQDLARHPNHVANKERNGGFSYVDGEWLGMYSMYRDLPEENRRFVKVSPRDFHGWKNLDGAEVLIYPRYNWHSVLVRISSIDRETNSIKLAADVPTGIRPRDRYFIRNTLEELDSPGEWFLDKRNRVLYFWPPAEIDNAAVYAPVVDNIIEIGPGAGWITIRGLTIECCEKTAVLIRNSENCLVAGSVIHNIGGVIGNHGAIVIEGGRNCGAQGNDIFDVDNYGIRLSGGDERNPAAGRHFADNNYVHHIGVLNGHGCGIFLDGTGVRVSHNLIHDTARSGIFGGSNDCIIEYNHIRHVGLDTEDMGGYYVSGGRQMRGLVIRYNYIHDVLGFGYSNGEWTTPYHSYGIYLDDGAGGAHVYGNIVADTDRGGVFIHDGRDNLIENNIFVNGHQQQVTYTGDLKEPRRMTGNKLLKNIIVYKNPAAGLISQNGSYCAELNQSDGNVFWHNGLPLIVGLQGVPAQDQWPEWNNRGFDKHSIVADPLFVDMKRKDYRLSPASPAWRIGFAGIPVEKIGPYKSEFRASWPIVESQGAREGVFR